MRFAFVTCVQLGLGCMNEIYRVGGRLDLVITLHDRLAREKSGRIFVDEFARGQGLDVLKVGNVNDDRVLRALDERRIDWLFIIGWSQIARPPLLQAPRRGVLGMHPTLLPQGRGRAAIPWAILKGLPETGVTLFQLDEGVDTGPILAQERLPIAPDETATTLYARVAEAHRRLMRRVWPDLAGGRIAPIPQDESRASVWPGRTPEDGRITPAMAVAEVDRLVRATTRPYPGAFWEDGGGVVRIWAGTIGDPAGPPPAGALRLPLRDGVYEALDHEREAPGPVE
jgi:methionyl-tRNA formyltransferase